MNKKAYCARCHCELKNDEIGLSLKCFGKGTKSFMCFSCMESTLGFPKQKILQKVAQLKAAGCEILLRKYFDEE